MVAAQSSHDIGDTLDLGGGYHQWIAALRPFVSNFLQEDEMSVREPTAELDGDDDSDD